MQRPPGGPKGPKGPALRLIPSLILGLILNLVSPSRLVLNIYLWYLAFQPYYTFKFITLSSLPSIKKPPSFTFVLLFLFMYDLCFLFAYLYNGVPFWSFLVVSQPWHFPDYAMHSFVESRPVIHPWAIFVNVNILWHKYRLNIKRNQTKVNGALRFGYKALYKVINVNFLSTV